jgi:hypothetical protein
MPNQLEYRPFFHTMTRGDSETRYPGCR